MANQMTDSMQAMVKAALSSGQLPSDVETGPVVTVARDYGAGGNEVGAILSKHLKVPLFDQEIIDQIVKRTQSDNTMIKRLDERLPSPLEDWLFSLVHKGASSRSEYFRRLVIVVRSIGRVGGIIMGRGAHLILENQPVFRLRVTGSMDHCARRVAARENLDLPDAKQNIKKVNAERQVFVRELFQHYPTDAAYYDMMLNSDHLGSKQISDLALTAMNQMGFFEGNEKK
ncbi:MAG: cytidylate kinase-like family protein [Magnetococcales bacterium]|nr:cytidylate kinase-like family protein [Magnetococcales bacterium]